MNSKRVYILGAGSSIGHSQGSFPSIKDFFSIAKKLKIDSEFDKLLKFGHDIYGVDIFDNLTDIEDLYTHLEIEIERKPEVELLAIRSQLLILIKKTLLQLENNFKDSTGEYNEFVEINHPVLRKNDTIITFNWDLLLDNFLGREKSLENPTVLPTGNIWPQYDCFIESLSAFCGWHKGHHIQAPQKDYSTQKGNYLKMHGSIDWTYCNNQGCSNFEKVFPIIDPLYTYICSECFEPLDTLLIPPLLNKNYRKHSTIRKIWNLAVQEIRTATEIIIWGYSLPPTDFYSKWLLRQGRKTSLHKIILINPDVKKTEFINRFKTLFKNMHSTPIWEHYESFNNFTQNNQFISADE